MKKMNINIGIAEKDRRKIANGLARMQADTCTLYPKTHPFHWNVTGPMFRTLHLMFETQYNEAWLAVDVIAERIRAPGFPAPGSSAEFAALAEIRESSGVPNAGNMIRQLMEGQETAVRTARSVYPVAKAASDQSTADMLTQRMTVHEQSAWMLRSLLQALI